MTRWFLAAVAACTSVTASAQGVATHHPEIPAASVAAEGGPGTLWVNPANLAYDADSRLGVFGTGLLTDDGVRVRSLAATVGTRGFNLGVHNVQRQSDDGTRSDFSLDYGTSVRLPKRLSVGATASWNLLEAEQDYFSYDVGLAWRPLPWLGLGAVAQNVGDPDRSGNAEPRSAAGFALRPGRWAMLGAEFAREFGDTEDEDHVVGTLRLRPHEGLYLRGAMDWPLGADVAASTFGVGLEMYFGGVGFGALAAQEADGITQTWFVGTDEPDESLARGRKRVPVLDLDATPAYEPPGGPSWLDTLELLRRAQDDKGVRGLVLSLGKSSFSFARAAELRDRILALEAAGKPVLVYLTRSPSTVDYYVASAATHVAMHPAADLELVGLSVEMTHFRGLFDLVGVVPQFVKRSDYKSAPESYTEIEPSPANVEMTEALLDDLYGELVRGIAEGRHTVPDTVRGWVDGGPHSANEALALGLVDVLVYPDQLDRELAKLHGRRMGTPGLLDQEQASSAWEDPKQIAVIYVEGGITSGPSSRPGLFSGRSSGSDDVVRNLERAASDRQVRAIVVRVDSPGGSSFASDEIWRTMHRIRETTSKPVIVSLGGVAASGGYYVASAGDAIWAEPNTITGSIGVYSGKFSIGQVQEKVGVTSTLLGRGANSAIQSQTRPWDDVQRAKMQSLVDETYEQFKDRVAEGRHMTPEAVEEAAKGRVWSGAKAQELGLVDGLGGLQDAIADARTRAGIPARRKVGLVNYSQGGGLVQSLAPALATTAQRMWERSGLAAAARPPDDLLRLAQLLPSPALLLPVLHPEEQVWALDPFDLTVGAGGTEAR